MFNLRVARLSRPPDFYNHTITEREPLKPTTEEHFEILRKFDKLTMAACGSREVWNDFHKFAAHTLRYYHNGVDFFLCLSGKPGTGKTILIEAMSQAVSSRNPPNMTLATFLNREQKNNMANYKDRFVLISEAANAKEESVMAAMEAFKMAISERNREIVEKYIASFTQAVYTWIMMTSNYEIPILLVDGMERRTVFNYVRDEPIPKAREYEKYLRRPDVWPVLRRILAYRLWAWTDCPETLQVEDFERDLTGLIKHMEYVKKRSNTDKVRDRLALFARLLANDRGFDGNSKGGTGCIRNGQVHANELAYELKMDLSVVEADLVEFGYEPVGEAGLAYAITDELALQYANYKVDINTYLTREIRYPSLPDNLTREEVRFLRTVILEKRKKDRQRSQVEAKRLRYE